MNNSKNRNIILVGFMGTGKTTIGFHLSKSLNYKFVDTDDLIISKTGKSISQIFKEKDEKYFRLIETEVLKECLKNNNQVISTGGGAVSVKENLKLLKNAGYVVWIKSPARIIHQRIRKTKNRPLVQTKNQLKTIKTLLSKRKKLYKKISNLYIKSHKLNVDEICFGISESAKIYFRLNKLD